MSNNKNQPSKTSPATGGTKSAETRPVVAPTGKPSTVQLAAQPPKGAPAQPAVPLQVVPLFRRIDWISFILTFLCTFAGYIYTLAPDLTLEDCGELATGSFYAGVPHPPGYPVWTVYSWVFTWLVPIGNIAYRVAISSAFAGAMTCGLVALMVSRGSSMIMEGIADLKNIESKWENALCLVCGFVAGMAIGFNGFMWSQAVIVEVYTLSTFSLTGVLVCLMRWIYAPHQKRYLYIGFFLFGICFNNHQSLLVVALGLELAIACALPKLGREFLFWNWMIWLCGTIMRSFGQVSMLSDNVQLLSIFNFVGYASFLAWLVLIGLTRKSWWIDILMVAGLLIFDAVARHITGPFGVMLRLLGLVGWAAGAVALKRFELGRDVFLANLIVFFLAKIAAPIEFFGSSGSVWMTLFGLVLLSGFVFMLISAMKDGWEWLQTIGCGFSWLFGAAFYLYMPLASMTNPPLNWGYPRTEQGFWHAFTRGQYERIHPTDSVERYGQQVQLYVGGLFEEMNFIYVLIGLVPFFFLHKMQRRERAWLIGLTGTYIMLSAFLLMLLNPAPDRQSRDLNRVFFTASHIMIAMGLGYGLAIIGAYLHAQFERFKNFCLIGTLGASAFALFMVAVRYQGFDFHSLIIDFDPSYSPIVRFTCLFSLALAVGGVAIFLFSKEKIHRTALLALMWLLPAWPVLSHWYDNEQRGHYYGYWFGHDMFTPPFLDPATGKLSYDSKRRQELLASPATAKTVYPEMDRDTVLYGGTDPGRFNPTYMIFCESFTPPSKRNPMDPSFDRRDVYLITQNALADGTYLNYIRAQFNRSAQIDPPFFSELARSQRETDAGETNFLARLVRPLDTYFLDLGDRIEERRRVGDSAFKPEHFTDLPGFTAKLKAAKDPLSKFLFDNLSKETQQLVTSGGNESSARSALAKDLTALIRRERDAWKDLAAQTEHRSGYTSAIASVQAEMSGVPAGPDAEKQRAKLKAHLDELQAGLAPVEKVIAGLNAVPTLYESNRFAGVQITPRTQRFIKENPRLHTRIRLNRILLEEAFPKEIAVSQGGVYPDLEILSASNEDSQKCFSEYLADAQRRLAQKQLKPGEDVKVIDNKVQVSGQVAVMAINGLLTKVIFDKNTNHEFYVEESFPLEWMYPHLTPFGIIMKINRQQQPELTEDMVLRDHEFWSQFSTRLIGNWITYDTSVSNICAFADEAYFKRRVPKNFTGDRAFLRDSDGQKAFSKLRSSIAGVYNWRITNAKSPAEQQRMVKEADFAFKQAYAYCPYSPEAIFRYVNLLVQMQRIDDALLIATTSQKLDPFNGQIDNLLSELLRIRGSMPRAAAPAAPAPTAAVVQDQLNTLEAQFKAQPGNLGAGLQLAAACIQAQQGPRALEVLDQVTAHPAADEQVLVAAANTFASLGLVAKVEEVLHRLVKLSPDRPEGRFELAAVQALQSKSGPALDSLSNGLRLSADRLAKDPKAPNLFLSATADTRLASLHPLPEFQQILDAFKPK